MIYASNIEPDDFENLLRWFSSDREQAGAAYNKVREGLVRFFRFKGCSDPPLLADETLNRVAKKIETFYGPKDIKKTTIIYGFASKVAFEHLRKQKKEIEETAGDKFYVTDFEEADEDDTDLKIDCMKNCLEKLSAADRKLFIEYYGDENEKKHTVRKRLAKTYGFEKGGLQVKIFRLRKNLARCIENCLKKKL